MKNRQVQRRKDRSLSSSRKFEEGLPIANKKQILGFFLVLFSLLVILSIVTYSETDQSRLESFNISDIFKKESQSVNYQTSNWLGIIGVIISGFFVRDTFGYFCVIIPGLLVLFGIFLMRKKPLLDTLQFSVYMLVLMILFSSLFGIMKLTLGNDKIDYTLVGRSGDYFSSITYFMLGSFGSYLLLVLLIIVFGFFMLDRDIVKSLARLRVMYLNMKEKFSTSMEEFKERREAEKIELNRRRKDDEERAKLLKKEKIEREEEPVIKDTKIIRPEEERIIKEEKPAAKKEIKLEEAADEELKPKPVISKTLTQKEHPGEASGEYEPGIIHEELEDYQMPSLELLEESLREEAEGISDDELKENGRLLQAKLLHFDVKIEKVIATPGPVVTLYELIPAEDVKLSKIESLQDDIALAMKAKGIRMIIPIPGKGTVGVEIPNHKPSTVKIRSAIGSKKFSDSSNQLPIAFGKTISGEVFVDDLAKMPHLLIAGSTGSGKSVGINTLITSLLYKLHPSDLKLVLIDPKKIELNQYAQLKNHYLAVSKDIKESIITTPQNAVLVLKSVEFEMEKRYERLANATVRNIYDYNKKWNSGLLKDDENIKHGKMPYLIVIIDELADLMLTGAREVEEPIARLAQLARAVGIHLVLATQRPSVDVITGVIKANFSARISYLVNSKVDSRTILDMNGAETLLGRGDMLYLPPGVAKPMRIQSPFISVEEVEKITDFIGTQKGFSRPFELPSVNAGKKKIYGVSDERDELFEEAARLIVRFQQGSVSLLQRKLKVGYARAARIVDELEEAGVVGPFDGSKAREVLVDNEADLENYI
jgi:DNA segregation ATPase FtsK/SpoIIIE, S-DNA-T family